MSSDPTGHDREEPIPKISAEVSSMAALHSQTTTNPRGPGARTRALDTAEGVLIGIRRIGTADAFDELVNAARRHGCPSSPSPRPWVALAGGNELPEPTAARAARTEWGALFWLNTRTAPFPRHKPSGVSVATSADTLLTLPPEFVRTHSDSGGRAHQLR